VCCQCDDLGSGLFLGRSDPPERSSIDGLLDTTFVEERFIDRIKGRGNQTRFEPDRYLVDDLGLKVFDVVVEHTVVVVMKLDRVIIPYKVFDVRYFHDS